MRVERLESVMSSRKRRTRDSTCCVPGSGYRSCKTKISLFRTPKDPERLQQWAQNIKRGDKAIDEASAVCERHFEPCFIERSFKTVVKGVVVNIPRDAPQLTKDAVPTPFPDAPKYMSKAMPQKRKQRNLCEQIATPPPPKMPRTGVEVNGDVEMRTDEVIGGADVFHEFIELDAPSPWTKVCFPTITGQVTFAHCHASDDGALDRLHVSRRVVLDFGGPDNVTPKATVYIRGKRWKAQGVNSA